MSRFNWTTLSLAGLLGGIVVSHVVSASPLGPPPVEHYFGLGHHALGQATLVLDADGHLILGGIGSSGEDGVAIDLMQPGAPAGFAPGWAAAIDIGPAGALPPGAHIACMLTPTVFTPNPVAVLSIDETNGGQAAVAFQQDACDGCAITVQIRLDGVVVASQTFLPPYPNPLVVGNLGSSDGERGHDGGASIPTDQFSLNFSGHSGNSSDPIPTDQLSLSVSNPTPTPLSLAGGLPEIGDEVLVQFVTGGGGSDPIPVDTISLSASNTGPITVSYEALLAHELTHVVQQGGGGAPNNAHMIGGGDLNGDGRPDIVVSNIGSSGEPPHDGVMFGVLDNNAATDDLSLSLSVETDWGDAGALPRGSIMQLAQIKNPNSVRFNLSVTETNGGQAAVALQGDIDPAANVRVDAVLHGIVMDSVLLPGLPAGGLLAVGSVGSSGPPDNRDGVTFSATHLASCDATGNLKVLAVRSAVPGPMSLTGSPNGDVIADAIHIRFAPAETKPISTFSLSAANVSQFTILDGDAQPEFINDLTHDGLPHDALGGAELTATDDGHLQVAHIGSGGEDGGNDGVAIGLGEAQGWSGAIDPGPAADLPPGAEMTVSVYSPGAAHWGQLSLFKGDNGETALSFEQDICAPCPLNVELLLDGDVVAEAEYLPPYPDGLVTYGLILPVKYTLFLPNGKACKVQVETLELTPMTLSGQPTVEANAVRLSLNDLPPGEPASGISTVEITADGIPDFTVSQQRLMRFDTPDQCALSHQALGQATMCASRDNHLQGAVDVIQALRIGNIGSSGQDGVMLTMSGPDNYNPQPMEEIAMSFEPLTLPAGGSLSLTATGTRGNNDTFDALATVAHFDSDSDIVTVDFSQLGAFTYVTEVYLQGSLVTSLPGQSGPIVGSVPAGSPLTGVTCGIYIRESGFFFLSVQPGFLWNTPVSITLADGTSVDGDELRVAAENPGSAVQAITSMSITGANLPGSAFTIIDADVVLIDPCPADINGSGTVDVDDLVGVILGWGACDDCAACPADTNDSCVVDVDDLVGVILSWGECA